MTFLIAMIASVARAGGGVLDINEACAAGPGCFAGDAAGFPVEINGAGSYRLVGNLSQPNPNTRMIEIRASSVTLDLNGFAIQGSNTFFGVSCSAPGSGYGIATTNGATDVVVKNGLVRGMGAAGVSLTSSTTSRVDRVVAEHNCGIGIRVGNASLVTASSAHYNSLQGFHLGATSKLSDCSALVNGSHGIMAPESAVSIERCVSNNNVGSGMYMDSVPTRFGTLVLDSRADFNDQSGIHMGTSAFINAYESGALILRTTTIHNDVYGIHQPPAVGFVTSEGNGIANNFGSFIEVACIVDGGSRVCP